MKFNTILFTLLLILSSFFLKVNAQDTNGQLGAWYNYNWTIKFGESRFGAMGDFQYRVYDVANDFQQLILRGGISYAPKNSGVTLLAGYSYFNSGAFGDPDPQTYEHRLYQDFLLSQTLWDRVFVGHRFRLEERFVENQDFRTRFRYFIAARVPVNQKTLAKNAIFFVVNNEVFVNAQKNIGDGRTVPLFDRNWLAGGLGYSFSDNARFELTYIRESTEAYNKGQLWVSLFHTF
ncbi:MAG: DUF2490 domain-containing protein [Leeuwenhoekiella sp.]